VDEAFPRYLGSRAEISRQTDLGDSIMTAIVLAPFASAPCRFTDLGRLRLQECERVEALRLELTRCGARVEEAGDTLTVWPSRLRGAEIETYDDHRMAMCFAVVGLKVPGIRLKDPGCVRKTFPNFFAKLALPAPAGVGARILCPANGEGIDQRAIAGGPNMKDAIVIALDGPSASGKGTCGRYLAGKLGFRHVDTGAMYRTFTWYCLQSGIDLSHPARVLDFLRQWPAELEVSSDEVRLAVNGKVASPEILRSDDVANTVAKLSPIAGRAGVDGADAA
jgi:hypothetical protein